MPMYINQPRRTEKPPMDHPSVVAIQSLPQIDVAQQQFKMFHEALDAEGYRLGIKYLDSGIYVPRVAGVTARSNRASKDPIHIFYPKFRPVDHPSDPKYPKPPISFVDAESCLSGMLAQQRKFKLFEHEDSEWKKHCWSSRIDPFQHSWHAANVYVTPLDSQFYFLSLDDVNTEKKKNTLMGMGLRPALIIASSINELGDTNEQWIIKIPKLPQYCQRQNLIQHFAQHLPKPIDDDAIRQLAQELNQKAGDPEVTSCTRDFRLPGFYQLKRKYIEKGIFHVVTIRHSEGCTCPIATERYHQIHEGLEKTNRRRVRPVRQRGDQCFLSCDEVSGTCIPSVRAGAQAPAPPKKDLDFYPGNAVYMAHAAEVQALEPENPKLAPGTYTSKFRVLQRLIITGTLNGIDQNTETFQDAVKYLKEREKSNLYIYLRTESLVTEYQNTLPTESKSLQAHYLNAVAFFHDPTKSIKAAARRMFYMRHTRSVIERTMIEAGIPADNAHAWAFEACSPSNMQIKRDARYFEAWSRIEPRPASKPKTVTRHGSNFLQKRAEAIVRKQQSAPPSPTP